jgi:hypothetical protein
VARGQAYGRAWIDGLPPELERQQRLLRALLDAVERDERFRALEVGCSLARGNAVALSDVDAGIWIADDAWDDGVAAVEPLLRGFAAAVDAIVLDHDWGRWLFFVYEDGAQLDVAARRVSTAKGLPPSSVALLDRDGVLAEPYVPASYAADERALHEWSSTARFSLLNVEKYLRRGSLWEARASLEEARDHLLRLHAAEHGVPYPTFGLTSIIDTDVPLPEGLERTVAGVDAGELRAAADALAGLLRGSRR